MTLSEKIESASDAEVAILEEALINMPVSERQHEMHNLSKKSKDKLKQRAYDRVDTAVDNIIKIMKDGNYENLS